VSVTRIPRSGCGIVARPIAAAGFGSAFISELIGPSEVRWLCGQLKRRKRRWFAAQYAALGGLSTSQGEFRRYLFAKSDRSSSRRTPDVTRVSAFSIGTSDDILQWFLEEPRNSGRRSDCKPPTGAVHGDPQSETPGPQRSIRGNSHSQRYPFGT